MSRLSLCVMTRNSGGFIEPLMRVARTIADEVVVAVDSGSTDATQEICAQYADKLFHVESPGSIEATLAWLNEQCSGDWILRLDDDELPGAGLIAEMPDLLADRDVTHFAVPRRWVIGEDRARYIAQRPYSPDWQIRLFRNIRSIVRMAGTLHTGYEVMGACRYLPGQVIYHLDFVYHDESDRERKILQYERVAAGGGLGRFYLPDPAALITRPVPAEDLAIIAPEAPALSSSRAPAPSVEVSLAEVRRAAMREFEVGPDLFRATIECGIPAVLVAGHACGADLAVRNESRFAWPFTGLGVPVVKLGHRWKNPADPKFVREATPKPLPLTLHPGELTMVRDVVLAPEAPGDYRLQWDLFVEGAGWFSEQGWPAPERPVKVIEGTP